MFDPSSMDIAPHSVDVEMSSDTIVEEAQEKSRPRCEGSSFSTELDSDCVRSRDAS